MAAQSGYRTRRERLDLPSPVPAALLIVTFRSPATSAPTPRLTTCFDDLAAAIRAWAKGWLPTEAAAELLISHRAWLEREDFLQVAVEVRWLLPAGRFLVGQAVLQAGVAELVNGPDRA